MVRIYGPLQIVVYLVSNGWPLFWAALTFRRGEASYRKWVAGVLSQKVLAPDLYCLFLCFQYPTK